MWFSSKILIFFPDEWEVNVLLFYSFLIIFLFFAICAVNSHIFPIIPAITFLFLFFFRLSFFLSFFLVCVFLPVACRLWLLRQTRTARVIR